MLQDSTSHHSESSWSSAITTTFRLFEFPSMSFGLHYTTQTFQRFLDHILWGLNFCFAYLDHIVFS
jgi:hypothetical protein